MGQDSTLRIQGQTVRQLTEDKQAVSQMREAVAADRQAVEQTALQFGQTSQDALTAIGQAQSTAVGAVKAEGNKQTTAVQEAGTQAVSEVTEAKTTAVEAVTTEGDTQTKRVEDAAAGIIADREQIGQNKTDIAGLVEGMTDLAPAIHSTVSDSIITANDATEGRPFRGLRVFGKSTQVRTTGAQLLPEQAVSNYFISLNGDIVGKNNSDYSKIIQNTENTTYYIFRKNVGTRFRAAYVDAIPTGNTPCTGVVDDTKDNISITVPAGKVLIINMEDTKAFDGLMVQKTRDRLPYEPYSGGKPSPSPEYPQEIVSAGENGSVEVEVKGKNLFDADRLSNGNFVEFRGVECYKYVDTDKGFAFDFSKNNSANQLTFTIKMYRETNLNNASGFRFEYSDGTNESHNIKHDTPKTVVTTKGKILKKITSIHAYNEVCYIDLSVTQLEYGTVPTPYESYRTPQPLTLATPNGLPGVPVAKDGNYTDSNGQQWVCDEIDLGRGKYVQRVVIENISGGWELKPSSDISGRFLQSRLTNTFQTADKTAVCNIANFVSWGAPTNDIYAFALNKKVIYFSPPKGAEITAEELNAKLNSLSFPVVVVGELATPIERDLTPEEIAAYKALRTYGPTTVITNDAGAGMEATYVADTGKYIQNLEERLNAKMVNIQSALISQKTSGGGHLTIADSSPLPVEEFSMTGKTEQMKTTGKNLLKPNDYNVYHELPLKAGTVVTLMTNGQLSEGGNIKFIGMENENVWFAIDKGKTRVCHSIGNKDVKGFYNLLTKKEGLEYMLAIGDVKIFEPYSGGFSSPSPDWEQPIEIIDQPVTITVKGGTESQSITLTPPRPFTKWDKLEKVDGAWCWVYQSAYTPSYSTENIATEYYSTTGELSAGAEVYYKTDAPENIPLTQSEQAQLNALTMYAGTTEITNNGGCTMDLTYTADTKTYIDNKLAAISAAMIGGT